MTDVMYSIKDIMFLQKQLNYELSMKGGSNDIYDFKAKLEQHSSYITFVFSIVSIIILYIVINKLIQNKHPYMIGGTTKSFQGFIEDYKKDFIDMEDHIDDMLKDILKKVISESQTRNGICGL